MAVNDSRSMNADMKMGSEDGRFKSLTPDRGGVVEMSNVLKRADQLPPQYNVATPIHQYGCGCGYC